MTAHDILRTALFVPASRPERFAKALASGADAVIIDLEDAVAPDAKALARENIRQFAAANPEARFLVRANDAGSAWFADDLRACAALPQAATLVLPKAESAQQVASAAAAGKPVLPLIESARGLGELDAIAAAPHVERLTFGALDLMLDLGATPDTPGATLILNDVRCRVLIASRQHGLAAPLDTIYPDFGDAEGLASAARLSHDMGFCGMLCIHPKQVPVVHRAFAPSAAQAEWARRVVEQAHATGASAFKLDGRMIDRPVIERARRVLELAARS
ncbi:MAG: CoA ester lyase [Candidimonas sp.]|nr:MAG: CoA ester lyase [Candidimonas sp.]